MVIKTFIKQYINGEDVQDIIFHSGIIVLKDTIKTILFIGVFYLLYLGISNYIHWPMLKWIFASIGIVLFGKYCFDFFNKYIDCLILSKDGITIFSWDGLYKYKTEFFDWHKIESVSHSQNSFRDKTFAKGDITIQLEHGIEYAFENVSQPKKYIKKLLTLKENYAKQKESEDEANTSTPPLSNENISILTEALSEVVKEYLEKKRNED